MHVRNVRSVLLSYPMPEPVVLAYYGGERTILKRDAAFIRIEMDNGIVGFGPGQPSEKARNAVENAIAPFLAGKPAERPAELAAKFAARTGASNEVRKIYAGVELALWDAIGKNQGAPVSELIGGRVRDRIRLYGSAGMYQPPEEYAAEAAGIAALGFSGYKMRPSLGPELDLETIRKMRAATGDDMDLMVDAHTWWRMGDRSYSPETIEQLAADLAEYRVSWLEEPLPPDDHAAYARLRARRLVPLASGEHEQTGEGFLDLIRCGAVDYVQADLVCQGGYTTGRLILSETAREGLRFAFHSWGTELETIAAAHLGICWPETVAEWLEYPVYSTPKLKTMYPFPLATEILKEPLVISAGQLEVSRRPGFGVEVDESVADRYPWIPGPWSRFTLISPPGTWSVTADHSVQWAETAG